MLCAEMVEVHWRDQAGRRWHGTALLEDISASGACLQVESAIPLGAEIHWECRKKRYAGQVRYCVYREIGYFVGVEFHSGSRWSRKEYRPQHLFDPRELMEKTRP